ncbi:MAG: branched-chain amino acid ABC transporter permease [bacterium]|nr:branched-chain amino acid ABC transporter permease [bacterium]
MTAQYVVDGLALGAVYALLALSYSLIFGVIRIVNFAQGELITLGCMGALAGWSLSAGMPTPLRVGLMVLGAIAVSCAGGLAMEHFLFRPLLKRSSPTLLGLIASLGASIFLQNVLRLSISSSDIVFPRLVPVDPLGVFGLQIAPVQFVLLATTAVLATMTVLFVERTRLGLTIIAVRDNRELAEANGIAVATVLRGVFIASSLLAAAAGVMMGLYYGVARYDMGFLPGIKGFTACILGGLGNVRGAAVAGILLGLAESLGTAYISSAYKDGYAFVLLIAVLLLRPHGLFGDGDAR